EGSSPEPAPPATLRVTLPPGAVPGPSPYRLTALGPQALPGLLPLGFSPVVAFELDGEAPPATIQAHLAGLPALALYLVTWDLDRSAWTLVGSLPVPSDGELDTGLPRLRGCARVALDAGDGAPARAAGGVPLR